MGSGQMDHNNLGRTGVTLPENGLGTWKYDGGVEPLRKGIELSACFIDTAESYGSEDVVGEAMRDPKGALTKVAAMAGKTEAQVALNWCIAKENVLAIMKASSIERVRENCEAGFSEVWEVAVECHTFGAHCRNPFYPDLTVGPRHWRPFGPGNIHSASSRPYGQA
jgi:diketogulonate reductase-like aldo/keto reductase